MPRKILIEYNDLPYHITNRSNNKEFFYIPLDSLWSICIDTIVSLKQNYGVTSNAFVLMSNHYHWILSTPNLNLSHAMTYFHREVARKANRHSGRINHFWGGRYKWCLIGCEDYYFNALKYVYRNPVEAGLSQAVEDYKYSSLTHQFYNSLWNKTNYFNHPKINSCYDFDWLNTDFKKMQKDGIKRALRRRKFTLPRGKDKKAILLDSVRDKKGLGTF